MPLFFYGCAKIDRVGSFQMNPTLSCHITMSQFYRYCKFSKNDFIQYVANFHYRDANSCRKLQYCPVSMFLSALVNIYDLSPLSSDRASLIRVTSGNTPQKLYSPAVFFPLFSLRKTSPWENISSE